MAFRALVGPNQFTKPKMQISLLMGTGIVVNVKKKKGVILPQNV